MGMGFFTRLYYPTLEDIYAGINEPPTPAIGRKFRSPHFLTTFQEIVNHQGGGFKYFHVIKEIVKYHFDVYKSLQW